MCHFYTLTSDLSFFNHEKIIFFKNMLRNIFFYFALLKKNLYLCTRYPEYNLYALKKLIPIEISTRLCEESGIFVFKQNYIT